MSEIHYFTPDAQRREERRIWAAVRAILEADNYKHKINGAKSKSNWNTFQHLLNYMAVILKITGLYERGVKNTYEIEINNYEFQSPKIPVEFNGYTILHISDLHLDFIPDLDEKLLSIINNQQADICLITGDLRKDCTGGFRNIIKPLKKISNGINAPDGIYATFGNHDTYLMETLQENINIQFIINETLCIKRGDSHIAITGTDDPFRYFTDQQIYALEQSVCNFKIAAVHTSELAQVAAQNIYSLYLCGHTHGGQICFPSGKPIISHQKEGPQFVKGIWKIHQMYGYTNKGCGVSGIPVRYNCPGEITYIKLRHSDIFSFGKV